MKRDKKSAAIVTVILGGIIGLIWGAASSAISNSLGSIFTPMVTYVKHALLPPPKPQIISAVDGHNKSILVSKQTTSNEVTIGFTANSSYGISHIECSVDKINDFSDCPNPKRFPDLRIGTQHIFYVKAFDKLDGSGYFLFVNAFSLKVNKF